MSVWIREKGNEELVGQNVQTNVMFWIPIIQRTNSKFREATDARDGRTQGYTANPHRLGNKSKHVKIGHTFLVVMKYECIDQNQTNSNYMYNNLINNYVLFHTY